MGGEWPREGNGGGGGGQTSDRNRRSEEGDERDVRDDESGGRMDEWYGMEGGRGGMMRSLVWPRVEGEGRKEGR